MAKFKIFDWLCDTCQERCEWVVDTAEAGWEDPKPCQLCGEGMSYRAPSGPPVQKASFVDGTKRPGFEDLKIAAKLEVEKANLQPSKRYTIQKEIDKLTTIPKK